MHQITPDQFKAAVELDPAWASKLTEPVEITGFCDMAGSEITHLSPLLHFTKKDEEGNSASFWYCKSLKIAEGKFEGHVTFSRSSIEKIGDLSCGKDNQGNSAFFTRCKSLEVAEGRFEGYVTFLESGIKTIGNLSCGKNDYSRRLNIKGCPNLKSIPITFNPAGILAHTELIKALTEARAFIQKRRTEIVEIEL